MQKLLSQYRTHWHLVHGVLLALAGLAVAAWAALRGADTGEPPTATETVALVVLAAVLQISGGAFFARRGRVEPEVARSAVRRIFSAGLAVQQLREECVVAEEANDVASYRRAVVRTSSTLAFVTRQLEDAISDWNDVHLDALAEVLEQQEAEVRDAGRWNR
jgi:hypothetical protein